MTSKDEDKYMSFTSLGVTSEEKIQEDVEKYKHMLVYEDTNIESFGLYKFTERSGGYFFYVNYKKPVTYDEIGRTFPFPSTKEENVKQALLEKAEIGFCIEERFPYGRHYSNMIGNGFLETRVLSKTDLDPLPSNTKSAAKTHKT